LLLVGSAKLAVSMETAAFSTGVSIQYPSSRATSSSSSGHRPRSTEFPFSFPADSKVLSGRAYRSDTEAYSVCQELAYHLSYEKTRAAVQELLRKNNDTSYSHVLRFFEKYCARDETAVKGSATASPAPSASPSGRRLLDTNAPVIFPEFHAFPTAAVIAGTDATSSDLWVEPLTHKLRRTFPLCVLVQRDMPTARRFVEWLAARLAKLSEAKKREEQWLEGLVESFDLLPLDQPPVAAERTGPRVTRRQEATAQASASTGITVPEAEEEEEEFDVFESSSSSESSDGEVYGKSRRRKRRLPTVVYGRWTMAKLLSAIQHSIDELVSSSSQDTSRELLAMLGELLQDRLAAALAMVKVVHEHEDVVKQRIACYDAAVTWLRHTLASCKTTAAKLLNVAPDSDSSDAANVHVGSTEMALALLLQRVLHQYESFLKDCALDLPVVTDRQTTLKQVLASHKNHYALKGAAGAAAATPARGRPFLLLCIEQLEAFSQQVLGDFLEIWTHFVRHQRESRRATDSSGVIGFVVGVASATSPALRRLDLAVTSRLELQFFSLVDSRKCFDDVLESLVVKANLPLGLGGDVLRAIARRHHRLPSVPRLLLALRFLLFTHFRRCPWSFLALAVNGSACSDVLRLHLERVPRRLSAWVKRQRRRQEQGRSAQRASPLVSWLAVCSGLGLADLKARVAPSTSAPGPLEDTQANWMAVLETAVRRERRRQDRWRMGWECFRAACTWLDVHMHDSKRGQSEQEDGAATHLALALEGRLGQAPRFMEVLRRMQHCTRWALLSGMIEDWRASSRKFGVLHEDDAELETTLSELAMLVAYARTEKTPAKMQTALRDELAAVFTSRLVDALLHSSVPGAGAPPADALVASWSVLADADVLDERLRFEYHDNLRQVLLEAGIGKESDTSAGADVEASWVHDVGLAFLFYQENASASLSLREWYDSFSVELKQASKPARKTAGKRRKAAEASEDAAIKARFVRAVCTLRHWGFIRSDAPRDAEQDIVEKLVFI
jgi:hypothetical protein